MTKSIKYFFLLCLITLFACDSGKNGSADKIDDQETLGQIPERLDLTQLNSEGVFSVKKQKITPDSTGVIADISLQLPTYEKGVFYRPFTSRLASGNRMEALWFDKVEDLENYTSQKPREGNSMILGAFLLLKRTNGNYLAIMPLVSKDIGNTICVGDGAFQLQTATYGYEALDAAAPLIAYAESASPYEATHRVWALAKGSPLLAGQINWRSDKTFPEPFKYLGWCSWEHYKKNINETIIVNAIKDIQQSDIPIRWVMVDDGYLDQQQGQLLSFGADQRKFPNGWKPILDLKDEKIKWMGLWRNFNGYMSGINPSNSMESLKDDLELSNSRYKKKPTLITKSTQAASDSFYKLMTGDTRENGFDIIKVDFQSDNWRFSRGQANAIRSVHENQKALEEQVEKNRLHLINCIAMQNFNVFNQTYSTIIRSSVDYKIDYDRIDLTLVQNFTNAFWLGHLHWTDQDMFHTSFQETARLMAVARAISGGPIYLSDETKNMDDTYLRPLMYEDGRIVGTLAPAVPLPETFMQDPYIGNKTFNVVAPLRNKSAAILSFNLNRDTELESVITPKDYKSASGMLQPYHGPWELPDEGILLYDYFEGKAIVLEKDFRFKLKTRQEKLVQLSPIKNGWSIIGRADKYLGGNTFVINSIDDNQVVIEVEEAGPILLWHKDAKPISQELTFESMGKGLWKGLPNKSNARKNYTINIEK